MALLLQFGVRKIKRELVEEACDVAANLLGEKRLCRLALSTTLAA